MEPIRPLDRERHRSLARAAPPALVAKIRAADVVGERKPVTVLFADVVGSTTLAESMDAEEWAEVLNGAFGVMAEAVYRYEGTIAQLHGDGMLVFFGAPVAHEDDPERAVRAALDMVQAVERAGADQRRRGGVALRIRVGINTGRVVVAEVGNDLRYDYTAIGDTTNVAARIQAAAEPGQVLVAEATHRFVAGAVDAEPLGPLTLKGKREPVAAFRVGAIRAPMGRARPAGAIGARLVGRDAERAALERALERARAGGALAIVTGEPGVGKSRLLAELRGAVDQAGVRWAEARAVTNGRTLAYGLAIDVVRAVLPFAPEAARRAARGDGFLGHLVGDGGGDAAIDRLEPQARRTGYVAAVANLIAATAAQGPLAVVCEDVHWADDASAETLSDLLHDVLAADVLVVITSRRDRDTAGWGLVQAARQAAGDAAVEVALEPLDAEAAAELLGELLAIESLRDDVRDGLLQRAAGNPLFVEELVSALVERGEIVRRGERWYAGDETSGMAVPETLQGLLLSRIDRMAPDARHALRVASALGPAFDAELLRAALGDGSDPGPALADLAEAGLVVPLRGGGASHAFRHALIQEATYETLLLRERRALHALVGEALERRVADDPELEGLVALHFDRAQLPQRALPHLIAAARRALARFANREAYELYGRVLAALPEDDADNDAGRLRVEAGLGQAEAGSTFVPLEAGVPPLRAVARDAEAIGDPHLEAAAHVLLARGLRRGGAHPLEDPMLRASLARLREIAALTGEARYAAVPAGIEGGALYDTGEFRAAATVLATAAATLEEAGWVTDASYFAGIRALAHAHLGEFDEALAALDDCARLAAVSGEPTAVLDVDLFRASVEGERGNLDEAIELAARGVEAAERIGNHLCALMGSRTVGEQQLRRGAPAAAIEPLERSSELSAYCNAGRTAVVVRALLAGARLQVGDGDGALDGLDAALAEARAEGNPFAEAEVHRALAGARLKAGAPWEEVAGEYEAAIGLFESLEARPALVRVLEEYARALRDQGRAGEAQQRLAQAARVAAALSH